MYRVQIIKGHVLYLSKGKLRHLHRKKNLTDQEKEILKQLSLKGRVAQRAKAERYPLAYGCSNTLFKLYDSYDAGLNDTSDTVFVCTESKMHIPMAAEAIQNRYHAMYEEPISDTDDGIDGLVELSEQYCNKYFYLTKIPP